MNSFKSIIAIIFLLLLGISSFAQSSDTLPNKENTSALIETNKNQTSLTAPQPLPSVTIEKIEVEKNEFAFLFNYKQMMRPVLHKSALC